MTQSIIHPVQGQLANTGNPPAAAAAGIPDTTTWGGIRELVSGLFGRAASQGVVWAAGFKDAAQGESWHGRAGLDWLEQGFPDMRADLYFCIGVMDRGASRRSSGDVVAQPLLIVDDIGTKVDRAQWDARFVQGCPLPTARIETSPGNETWIWALDGDAASPERSKDLALIRAWLVELKLTDNVMDVARYIRLPGGWNSKPKYRAKDPVTGALVGEPPRVRLLDWRLPADGRVSVDALGQVLVGPATRGKPADWREAPAPTGAGAKALMASAQLGSGALVRSADMNHPEAIIRLAQDLGLMPTQIRPGVVEALCPNMAAHTTRAETGFAFLGGGLCQCNHASCQHLTTVDFRDMMLAQLDERLTQAAGVGALAPGAAQSASEWWARESLRDALGLSGAGAEAEAAEAEATAAEAERLAQARATRQEAERLAQANQTIAALSSLPVQPVGTFSPARLPPRRWVYGRAYARGVYSVLVAAGGTGKSALTMVEAVAMATGRELLSGEKVANRPVTVWLHNGEDSMDEQQRRLAAAMIYHGVSHADLGNRLILTSGHDHPIKLATLVHGAPELTSGSGKWIVDTARSLGVDVLILDPLGAVHGLPENSNEAVNLLAGGLRRIAIEADIAIGIVHHVSQAAAGNMVAAGANAARGATALVDGARVVRQLSRADEKEAPGLGIKAEDRWKHLRVSNGKANMSRIADAHWLRLVSVRLGNATADYPSGDEVQTVERWNPPKGITGTTSDLARLQDAITARGTPLPRRAPQAPDWVGYLLADLLGLDVGRGVSASHRTAEQTEAHVRVTSMINHWIGIGGLTIDYRPNPKGKTDDRIAYVAPGQPAVVVEAAGANPPGDESDT